MSTKGIDISKYQQNVDFTAVKESGIDFIIARASLGSYTKDTLFDSHYEEAKSKGLGVGAYHYFYATNEKEAIEEAKFFLETIKGKQFDYPLAIDVEEASIAGAGKDALTTAVIAFCEVVENAGYYISVYANPSWLNNYLDAEKLKPYDLWLAHWDIAEPSRECGMWQYTSSGTVAGISGRVDMNYAYKDYPSLIRGIKEDTLEPITPPPSVVETKFKVGDKVKVVDPINYDNGNLFNLYFSQYDVMEVNGDRVVIGVGGVITSAISDFNIELVGNAPSVEQPTTAISVGSTVKVRGGATSYEGANIASFVYSSTYEVYQISGNRAVIGQNSINTAFKLEDLILQ